MSKENTCAENFLVKIQALNAATLLKSDSSKYVFLWILWIFKNTYFVKYLQMVASESVTRCTFSFVKSI